MAGGAHDLGREGGTGSKEERRRHDGTLLGQQLRFPGFAG